MKAIAARPLPSSDPQSLVDIELPQPTAAGRDLLVRVEAVSVNPVDTKIRAKPAADGQPRILGWDAAGVVAAAGPDAAGFRAGDAVYYAGDVTRPGANAEFQLVDARLAGRKPTALSFADAAALPLTTLTAWEALFERLGLDPDGGDRGATLLVIGGAGGVGSIAIQLAKRAGLTVIATASRPETRAWVVGLGADHVVNHREPLPPQLAALGHRTVDAIANFHDTDAYWAAMAELIRPQGRIVSIVENTKPLDLNLLKSKSASFAWEFMFTRSMFQTPDLARQGEILDRVAALVEAGEIRTTRTETLSPITAATLREAHARSESGRTIGKLVVAGWPAA